MERLPIRLSRAMRSDGLIIEEPLQKWACGACGAMQGENTQPLAPYRRSNGQAPGDIARHARVADGLIAEIARLELRGPALEVGAASFQTALHLAERLPDWRIVAVEPEPELLPVTTAVEIHVGPFEALQWRERFGLVYSNHVLEHIADTRGFLRHVGAALAPEGMALLACPSGLIASHEMLFADHLFHFTPRAVAVAARDAGLALIDSRPCPWEPMSRLFLLRHGSAALPAAPDDLTAARRAYLAKWEEAEARLLPLLGDAPILFGAGEFSQLIRAYLPRVHDRITAITVDNPTGARAFDKPVFPLAEIDLRGRVVLLGTHPSSVATVAARLEALGAARILAIDTP